MHFELSQGFCLPRIKKLCHQTSANNVHSITISNDRHADPPQVTTSRFQNEWDYPWDCISYQTNIYMYGLSYNYSMYVYAITFTPLKN